MAGVRYFCLSDLHLGAAISVLTNIDDRGRARPEQPSPALETLGACVRKLLPPLCGGEPPTLVLLGDVLDLAFSTTRDAAMAFQRFVEAFFPAGQPPLFAKQVLYLPGNHDHREWQVVRDELFVHQLRHADGLEVPEPAPITPLFEDPVIGSKVVTALLRTAGGLADAEVKVAYPNFGFTSGERCVLMHHGHYIESMYRLMTELQHWLAPNEPAADDIARIERENGPWIDFFWSAFGDEGRVGAGIFNLYEVMEDPAATHDIVKRLAERMLAALGKSFPIHASTEISAHGVHLQVGGLTEALLDLVVGRAAQRERLSSESVLSPASVAGLRWYLAGPLRKQIADAKLEPSPNDFRFIFGHTHKPFQDQLVVDGYLAPVQVFNTGGWVLDDPGMSPSHGAAAVLVDDDANVASLRLFQDPRDGDVGRVRAAGTGGFPDRDNALLAKLESALSASPSVFDAFSSAVSAGIQARARFVRRRYFDPDANPAQRAMEGSR